LYLVMGVSGRVGRECILVMGVSGRVGKKRTQSWVLGQSGQELGAYGSDPTVEKPGCKESSNTYGPEMLETWLLLEFCDRYHPRAH